MFDRIPATLRPFLLAPAMLLALGGVAVAALTAPVVAGLASVPAVQVSSPALPAPAVDDRDWRARHGAFAARLTQAFGISDRAAVEFAPWILEAATRQDLPPALVASLVYTESSFRKNARSWAGAIGPAQVNPRYWQRFCQAGDLTDPEQNIYCGAQVLRHFMDRCGGYNCALARYNVGVGNLRQPWYRKAGQRYAQKVDRHWETLAATVL